MKFPASQWNVQSAISFDGDISGSVSIAVGADDALYFAMAARGNPPTGTTGMTGMAGTTGMPGIIGGGPLVTQGLYTIPMGTYPPLTPEYASFLTSAVSNPSFNIVIGKVSSSGVPLWILLSPVLVTLSDESQPSLVIGPSNELYVAYGTQGGTYGNLNQQLIPSFCNACKGAGPYDIVLARIDEVGGQPSVTWVKQDAEISSCNNETVPQLAIDPINRVLYMAWQCNKSILCFPAIGSSNLLLSCFGFNGKQLWIEARTNLNSTGINANPAIAVDTYGGVYIAFETTGQVQGGATPSSQQIELIRYQTRFKSPGAVAGYARDWIYSGISSNKSFFMPGVSQSPTLTVSKTGTLCIAFTTLVPETSNHNLVLAAVQLNGTFLWMQQGSFVQQATVAISDCGSPFLTSDCFGNIYCSLLTNPGTSQFIFKLNPDSGNPLWGYLSPDLKYYTAYPYALTEGPHSVFPSGAFQSKNMVAILNGDLYTVTTVPPPLAPTGDTHVGSGQNICITQLNLKNYAEGQTAYEFMIGFQPLVMGEEPPSLV